MPRPEAIRAQPLSTWPARFQTTWAAALRPAGLFDEPGRAARWKPASQVKTRKGFGWWLSWLVRRGEIIDQPLTSLVTRERVRTYIEELEVERSGYTIACRVQELYDAVRVMAPGEDWSWLRAAMENMRDRATSVRDKAGRLRPAAAIEALGLRLMAEAKDEATGSPLRRAGLFRDGLMIALLIRRPLRNGNFHALRLGEHLVRSGSSWTLQLEAGEMKSHRVFEAALPAHLTQALDRYLGHHRPVLLAQGTDPSAHAALWVSREGTAMAAESVHNRIRRQTEKAFGAPIPPHWFRDAAVTALVLEAPKAAMASMHLLGHATPEIAQAHYNRAQALDSSRRHAAIMAEMMEVGE